MNYVITFDYITNQPYPLMCEQELRTALAHCGYDIYHINRTSKCDSAVFDVNLYDDSLGTGDRHRLQTALDRSRNLYHRKVTIQDE